MKEFKVIIPEMSHNISQTIELYNKSNKIHPFPLPPLNLNLKYIFISNAPDHFELIKTRTKNIP